MTSLRGTFNAPPGSAGGVIPGPIGFNGAQMNDPVVPLWSATLHTLNSTFVRRRSGARRIVRRRGLNGNGVTSAAGFQ